MLKNIEKSVFKIITADGVGSGFKIQGYDFIITNFHVIEGCIEVAVETSTQDKYLGKVVMANPELDIAFVYASELKDEKSCIILDKHIEVQTTQKIYICGFPFGMPFTITEGIVSNPKQLISNRYILQTDAAVNPGNSGGAMVNEDGVLLAVTASKFTNADNVGFGIRHIDLIKELEDYQVDYDIYKVKCHSCDNYISQKISFCDSCGNEIKKSVFEKSDLSSLAIFIEESLKLLDINPVLCREGRDYWSFYQGRALIRIFDSNSDYLIATSPLNELPKSNLKDLLYFINTNQVSPFYLGIKDNKIYLSYRIHLSDMFSSQKENIQNNLKDFILKVDELDDFFHTKFNCNFAIESKNMNTLM
ncbi:serine protease [Pasteurella atlantica]|uniref:Serine protease n=2 Tax=Pasteurellaceae TaxID=712 RepID=A0ACC6HJC6_9PAST|nr:serine protease [Pasteurella atlantica]MDP8050854.1 serine protease [Pasteurella atlantica]MDP8104124.1 serine protease [Pasteurella atlantica]MDP8147510.1 serine protease [Pasteurella atlantica]